MKHPVSLNAHVMRRQRGAVLFVALIFLILLTLLALTATSTSILQERMTGGMRNQQLSLLGTESGLRGGEQYLWQLSSSMVYDAGGAPGSGQPLPPCPAGSASINCVHVPYKGIIDPVTQTFRTSAGWLAPANDGGWGYGRTLTGLTGDNQTASLGAEPRFMLESLGLDLPPSAGGQGGAVQPQPGQAGTHVLYRITARSQGGTEAVVRVAESVFSAADLTNTGINPGSAPTP